MDLPERKLTEKESLDLIATMISRARESYRDTGITAIMWGAVIAVCSLVQVSEIHFAFQLPFDIYWLTVVAVIPQVLITIREKRNKRVKSYDDAYQENLWLAFGICIFLLIIIINNVFANLNPLVRDYGELVKGRTDAVRFRFYEYTSSFFLLLYGFPTFVTGVACRFRPMLWGGIICWACCLVTLYTSIEVDLLLTAASAIAAWLVPGIIMKREYNKYKKGQVSADV